MPRQLRTGLVMMALMTALTGLAYPLLVTGVAQVAFGHEADGSFVEHDGEVVGSSLIGQPFDGAEWFQTRPSAAGEGYDGQASSGSNLGPLSEELLLNVEGRVALYREVNGLSADVRVPVDAVTSSASGLDPHISIANARLQAARVAGARDLALGVVLGLIDDHTDGRALGVLGDPGVNVLELNLAVAEFARAG